MSIQFNDTATRKGLVQLYEKECGLNFGDVSGNTGKLKDFAADANIAFDDFLWRAIKASGKWQVDDTNHTKDPVIYLDLVSGQRNYSLLLDEQSNMILDVYKVAVLSSSTATLYEEIEPIDEQSDVRAIDMIAENTAQGVPCLYDKTGNGINLDPPSSYNATRGLKIYINREPSYFTYTDTTKKPGVPGILHEYFVINPAVKYARRFLSNDSYTKLNNRLKELEVMIDDYFSKRAKDEHTALSEAKFEFR